MPDREKVIKGLHDLRRYLEDKEWSDKTAGLYWETAVIAEKLLKEQDAQLVLNIGQQISCKSGSCPKCGKMLNTTCNKRYCGSCGQAVKWDG